MQIAERLGDVQEYYFSRKLKEISRLKEDGRNIINLAIGSPDLPPHPKVVKILQNAVGRSDVHNYQPYQGLPELRSSISKFYGDRFKVKLDSSTEILPLMGSKEGIMHISMAYLNKGDQVLIPELGYLTYSSVTRLMEAEPVSYPLMEDDCWEPDWDFLENFDFSRVKIIWINYPQMPTGAAGSIDVLQRFVDLANREKVLLVNDNPYSFILNPQPISVFNCDGAANCAIELNSMSKTFNMSGWRVGWVSGNEAILKNVLRVKSNMDSGMFRPIQEAAMAALDLDQSWYDGINQVYDRRRKKACELLDALNCRFTTDQTGMFVWARVSESTADDLVDRLLYQYDIFVTPGHVFGEKGSNYIRVSLCSPEEDFENAIRRIQK